MLETGDMLRPASSRAGRAGWLWAVAVTCSLLLVGFTGCGDDESEGGGDSGQSTGLSGTVDESAVEKLIEQAVLRVKAGDAKGAIELLSQVIGNDASNARAFKIRGDIYSARKQDANALADYSAAIRIEPNSFQKARWLNARGFFLFIRGKRDASLRDLEAAIELDADYTEAWNNCGLLHIGDQDYEKAIADFSRAIATDPKFADAWNNRGFAYFRSNDHAKAVSDFDQALVCDPKFVMAYNNRALLRMSRKEYREVVADCTLAIKLKPDNPRFYQLRREAYRRLGKSKEALADSEKLVWLIRFQQLTRRVAESPKQAAGYIQRARHLAIDGRGGAALADYQRAITVEPGEAHEAYLARARHWIATGDLKRATADCSRALQAGGGYEAYSLRGETHKLQGNWDLAIADFTRVRRFDEVVAETYLKRAAAHKAAGRTAEAAADLKRAAELDPERSATSPKPAAGELR
jgi:tetratricopeptide (TPR) repeat protein